MSRYIDVDETLEQIRKKLGVKSLSYLLEMERQIVAVIQSMSSIDIVRCKECKHRGTDDCPMCNECGRNTHPTLADDFCSSGERKDE